MTMAIQSEESQRRRLSTTGWAALLVAGVTIRISFLALSGRLEPFADESNYIYLSLLWHRFGFYSDGVLFLWPPGYPFVMSRFFILFGSSGMAALKLAQVLGTAVIGGCTIWMADRLFGRRAAWIAGGIWCVHMPLIGFSHYLWPETLFLMLLLPALCLLFAWSEKEVELGTSPMLLAAAGVLTGLAVLTKEVLFWLLPLIVLMVACRPRDRALRYRIGLAVLFLLSSTTVLMPWTLRNLEVYGRIVPAGATLGKNMLMGLNGGYRNLDYPRRMRGRIESANAGVRRILVGGSPESWRSSKAVNVIDRARENTAQGVAFARRNPGYVLRSRIKHLADWVSPMSFFVRHYGLGRYSGVLDRPGVRRFLVVFSLILTAAVLAASIPGLAGVEDRFARRSIAVLIGYFLIAGVLINASTRYRISIAPLLIVCASGFVASLGTGRKRLANGVLLSLGGVAVLLTLWLLNWREVATFVELVW